MATDTVLFEYDKCDTCRKARKWLDANGVPVRLRPIVDERPGLEELRDLWQRSGLPLQRFFNTSGQSYRALPDRAQLPQLDDEQKLRLLAADGKLVRRPILDDGKRVLVGFAPDAYEAWLADRSTST